MTTVFAGSLLLGAAPAPAAASVEGDMAARILAHMNADRTARGLVVYRPWGTLASLASERAARMAATMTLSHDAAGGDIGTALDARRVDWMGYGENIAMSGYPWGSPAADNVYAMWKNSSVHRGIMFSNSYNYAGIGVARAADGSTWVAAVFTESRDHTAPVARKGSLKRSGTTLTFTWSGFDRRLQTHTAGLRSFDVQMKRDNGSWRTIRDNTTSRKAVLYHRKHGHWFSFRVQAADRRGTLSSWTSAARIWVP
jgi:hypothetical protein